MLEQLVACLAQTRGQVSGSDLLVPVVLLGVVLGVVLVLAIARSRRRQRLEQAFDHLSRQRGFTPIEDAERRMELGAWAGSVVSDDDYGRLPPVRFARGLAYEADGFAVHIVALDPANRHLAGHLKLDSPIVICDHFETELPTFRILPANFLLRHSTGEPVFPDDTEFGRSNLVFSDEPLRTQHVLDEQAQALLTGNKVFAVHALPDRLLMYRHDQSMRGEELDSFVQDCATLATIIRDNARTMPAREDEPPVQTYRRRSLLTIPYVESDRPKPTYDDKVF